MTGYLQQLANLSIPAFVISTMLAAGMSQPLSDVVAPLKKPFPVLLALLANFALAPLLAGGRRVMPGLSERNLGA